MANVFDKESKRLLKSENTPDFLEGGKSYEHNRFIINPKFVPDCESKYIIIEPDNAIREMTEEEKAIVNYIAPLPEPIPLTAEELEKERKLLIAKDIALEYPLSDEMSKVWKVLSGELTVESPEIAEYHTFVDNVKTKYNVVSKVVSLK